ncbi:hypothetical protein ACF0H5_012050 [Mactra antiquata]
MYITPSTVSLEGASTSPTAVPSTAEVRMECTADNMGSVYAVYAMYIKRDSSPFMEISVTSPNNPKLSSNVPNDIQTKSPTLEGSISTGNPTSSVLRVRYLVSRMTCDDQAQYNCIINYKPMNTESRFTNQSSGLTVNVQPRNLQIAAIKFQDYTTIQNQSLVTRGSQVEFTCNGYTGGIQSTMIEWYRKTHQDINFQRFYPNQQGDVIDDGEPTLYRCEYSRTSKLRYTISTVDSGFTKFRCEVPGLTTSSGAYRAYSSEFHINTGFTTTNKASSGNTSSFIVWIATVFFLGRVFTYYV